MGEVALLHKTVKEINNRLTELQEKCSQLFKGTCSKPKSRKRKQKQTRGRLKRQKKTEWRLSYCKVVIKTIASQHNADSDAEPIGPLEHYYEGISTLKKKQLPYIRYAFDKGLFTVAAKDVIKQHMTFTMSETEDDDIVMVGMTMMMMMMMMMMAMVIIMLRMILMVALLIVREISSSE